MQAIKEKNFSFFDGHVPTAIKLEGGEKKEFFCAFPYVSKFLKLFYDDETSLVKNI